MTPTPISEDQENKLQEMCNVLFPEYQRIKVRDYQIDIDRNHYSPIFVDVYHGELTVPFNIRSIPWFEFIFLYLVAALQNKMTNKQIWSNSPPYVSNLYRWKEGDNWTFYTKFMFHYPKAMQGGTDFPVNPIDYLYEEFKKLKS